MVIPSLHYISGETGFCAIQKNFGWPINPMLKRIDQIDPTIPMTFIYGSESWIDFEAGEVTKQKRAGSFVQVKVIGTSRLLLLLLIGYAAVVIKLISTHSSASSFVVDNR